MKIWLFAFYSSIIALPLMETLRFGIHPFDQKRLAQVVLLFFALILVSAGRHSQQSKPSPSIQALLATTIISLLVSTLLAPVPIMALLEAANFVGIILCCYWLSSSSQDLSVTVIRIAAVAAACYTVVAISHLTSGIMINASEAIVGRLPGFSNIRAFSHWQTWTLPFIGALPLFRKKLANVPSYWLWSLAILWWALFYIAAGRGTALATLIATTLIVLLATHAARRWASVLITTAIIGNTIGYSWINFEAQFFTSNLHSDGGLLGTTTSDRLFIWHEAWQLFMSAPWFGIGPMHFSHFTTSPVASPHNFVLLMLAETGIIFSAILLSCLAYVIIKLLATIKRKRNDLSPTQLALTSACLAAGCHSLVSGVQLAPYSQLWLILVVSATAQQLFQSNISATVSQQRPYPLQLGAATLALALIVGVVFTVIDPALPDPWADIIGRHAPRFWSHGHF